MPKGIAVNRQGRLAPRTAMSDTNLLLTITVAAMLCLFLVVQSVVLLHKNKK